MAELEELALDPLVPPEVVLGGESLDERGDLSAGRRPSRPARIGSLPGDQAPVPAQDGAGGDGPAHPQLCWQEPDECGEDCAVGPVDQGAGIGAAQHGDLVPQHERPGVFGGRRTAEQLQPAAEPDEDEVEQAQGHG